MIKHFALFTVLFASFSMNTFAAEQHSQKMSVVSVSGASTLDELTRNIEKKAAESGASSFKITSAGGNNKLHGTAILYR
ncbi:DUF1471 domain-containing protein [Salmonella enterica]|jgi:multiple stress resistance protein BhsA|nr:DUF1471 domain-containing protein [Salmonella enterica]MJF13711.1 DUF1471 domain-containing protein [Salmonella enterica subsp. enterica]HEC7292088.1 DUF1471 domain-containing protein [Salmonella enterica subsp. enterica serovar Pensacola]EDS9872752.1 DUF1471 domain-containing protein [Salmonella enterica]EHY2509741.1 DUF1471 domain-containing protein [Salmonella enterica]